jgi:hypothetical protein
MAASERTLPTNTAQDQAHYSPLPSVYRAIEYNLAPNYRRQQDSEHGYHWIYRVGKTNLSARVYPNVDGDTITISIYDDSKNPTFAPTGSELIKQWSGDLRMTGNWRRRLRRASGEALVLVNQRPRCPSCRKPLVLRERRDNHQQFFGCEDYPRCNGSITIIDHDVDRKKAGSYRPPIKQNVSSSQQSAR